MSLRKAVEALLREMEIDQDRDAEIIKIKMMVYIGTLKGALEASSDEGEIRSLLLNPNPNFDPDPYRDRRFHQTKEDPLEKTFLQVMTHAEESGPSMAVLEGGPLDGDSLQIDPKMPVGAKVPISSTVYVFTPEKKLVFSKEETDKLMKRRIS